MDIQRELKKMLDNPARKPYNQIMVTSYNNSYPVASESNSLVKNFKRAFDFLLNALFVFVKQITDIFTLKRDYQSCAFLL